MPYALQVITSTARRGAESFAADVQQRLVERGHDARLVALTATTEEAELPVEVLGRSRWGALPELRRLATGAAVVVGHGSSTLPACALVSVGIRAPFVYRNIGSPLYWAASGSRRLRVMAALRRASRVAALWPGSRDVIVEHFGVPPERVRVIPNARPAAQFPEVSEEAQAESRLRLAIDRGGPVAVYLGALSHEKGPDVLLDALQRMRGWTIVLAGGGPLRSELEHRVGSGPNTVRFIGQTDDPAAVLAAADVVVLPSRTEGLPGVAIEAGLSGLPVVATDVGGTNEVVVDGTTGVLVPPEDPAAFAEAMEIALSHRSQFGAAARRRCLSKFELEVVVDQWEQLLDEVAVGRW
jgi:glycosyltransferase involved in cell wall biosynthesis